MSLRPVPDGFAAYFTLRVLRSPELQRLISNLPSPHRAAVVDWVADLALAESVALERNGETETVDPGPALESSSTDLLDTQQVAAVLGLSVRRVQQLAAHGWASRHGGRWLFDRDEVAVLAATRQGLEER